MSLEQLLQGWLPKQRWFAGKDHGAAAVRVVRQLLLHEGDPGLLHLLVEVGERAAPYQLLLGVRAELPARLEHSGLGRLDDVGARTLAGGGDRGLQRLQACGRGLQASGRGDRLLGENVEVPRLVAGLGDPAQLFPDAVGVRIAQHVLEGGQRAAQGASRDPQLVHRLGIRPLAQQLGVDRHRLQGAARNRLKHRRHAGVLRRRDPRTLVRVQRLSRHAKVETLQTYDDNRTDMQGQVSGLLSGLLDQQPAKKKRGR